ncbi:MAG: phosphoadenylyl-sulfate reductase [Candidatus Aminicenantes bacterium]|nr:phosphoadenylyl-sulfate reductase [Candidatus Aminicenantes bacterium]
MKGYDLTKLNMQFRHARCEDVISWVMEKIYPDAAMISSFQASGVVLLDLVRDIQPDLPVFFIDTGYHFPETLEFRDRLIHEWKLNVVTIGPETKKKGTSKENKEPLYKKDPDLCCRTHKVEPLKRLKKRSQITAWLSALRRDQNSNRESMNMFMHDQKGHIRIHPLIHWSRNKIWQHIYAKRLPFHPLYDQGYTSIGCFPPECTTRGVSEKRPRSGRWPDSDKTECGLHLDLVKEEEEAWVQQLKTREKKSEKTKKQV